MTKFVFWVGAFIMLLLYMNYHDKYANKCLEAGGEPILAIDKPLCLHPSAVIELEMEKRK